MNRFLVTRLFIMICFPSILHHQTTNISALRFFVDFTWTLAPRLYNLHTSSAHLNKSFTIEAHNLKFKRSIATSTKSNEVNTMKTLRDFAVCWCWNYTCGHKYPFWPVRACDALPNDPRSLLLECVQCKEERLEMKALLYGIDGCYFGTKRKDRAVIKCYYRDFIGRSGGLSLQSLSVP